MTHNTKRICPIRKGSATIEMIIAVVLATTVLVSVAQLMSRATRQHRVLDRRDLATGEVANIMEDLMSRSWDQVSPEHELKIALSPASREALEDAVLDIKIATVGDDPNVRRISVELSWLAAGQRRCKPICLTAWRYRLEGK
jgi:hypothetical protein